MQGAYKENKPYKFPTSVGKCVNKFPLKSLSIEEVKEGESRKKGEEDEQKGMEKERKKNLHVDGGS